MATQEEALTASEKATLRELLRKAAKVKPNCRQMVVETIVEQQESLPSVVRKSKMQRMRMKRICTASPCGLQKTALLTRGRRAFLLTSVR